MTTTKPMRAALALLLAGAALAAHAAQDASRWIHGSWVNVRATAAADGAIVDHLTTNTAVVLRAESGKSCEIAWNKDGRDGHGFVPCKLLGDKPLTALDAMDSPLRAFWIEPSMAHLFAAGDHFAATLLSPAQRALETGMSDERPATRPRLVRYPLPEFDAMKALLAKGIIAPGDHADAWGASCDDLVKEAPSSKNEWRTDPPRCKLPSLALRLPKIRPSLFKAGDKLLPADASLEDMSAGFGIVERGRTISGPKWEDDDNMPHYSGAWDIGEYELTLDKPVIEHVIGRTGLVGAYRWLPKLRTTPFSLREGCSGRLADSRRAEEPLTGYPEIMDELMWFYTPQPFPFRKATIKTHVERGPKSVKGDEDPIRRVVVYEIDLNGDGVPDFVRWEIIGVPESGGDPSLVKWEAYVNVGGRWYPFGWNYDVECT